MNGFADYLPYRTKGKVVKGFGRGSKELGVPTANLSEEAVESLPEQFDAGIYYGLASVDCQSANMMVMSIGWNPFYNNTKKSMEVNILHAFDKDFYGSELRIIVLGYIRPELNFDSLDALIKAIHKDIDDAETALSKPDIKEHFNDKFLFGDDSLCTQETQTQTTT